MLSPSWNLYKYCMSRYIEELSAKTSVRAYSDAFKESLEFKQCLM